MGAVFSNIFSAGVFDEGTGLTTYTISGNCGLASATVSYSGAASGAVLADGAGNFSISGLGNGFYTVTPSASGYIFSPSYSPQTVSNANVPGVNFSCTKQSFSISGNCGRAGALVALARRT